MLPPCTCRRMHLSVHLCSTGYCSAICMEWQSCHFRLGFCIPNLFDDTSLTSNWYVRVCLCMVEKYYWTSFTEYILRDSISFRSFSIFKIMLTGLHSYKHLISLWPNLRSTIVVQRLLRFSCSWILNSECVAMTKLLINMVTSEEWKERTMARDIAFRCWEITEREYHPLYVLSGVVQNRVCSSSWRCLLKEHFNVGLG